MVDILDLKMDGDDERAGDSKVVNKEAEAATGDGEAWGDGLSSDGLGEEDDSAVSKERLPIDNGCAVVCTPNDKSVPLRITGLLPKISSIKSLNGGREKDAPVFLLLSIEAL